MIQIAVKIFKESKKFSKLYKLLNKKLTDFCDILKYDYNINGFNLYIYFYKLLLIISNFFNSNLEEMYLTSLIFNYKTQKYFFEIYDYILKMLNESIYLNKLNLLNFKFFTNSLTDWFYNLFKKKITIIKNFEINLKTTNFSIFFKTLKISKLKKNFFSRFLISNLKHLNFSEQLLRIKNRFVKNHIKIQKLTPIYTAVNLKRRKISNLFLLVKQQLKSMPRPKCYFNLWLNFNKLDIDF